VTQSRLAARGGVALLMMLVAGLAACRDRSEGGRTEEAARGAQETASAEIGLPISASLGSDTAGEAGAETPPAPDPEDVVAARRLVESYYAAIDAQDYERAYAYWGDSGRASGQTYLEFVAGFAETADVSVASGEAGRVEGAAGSRYLKIPVVVAAITKKGDRQRFEGSYTLRRVVVEGATPEQRRWHLYDAALAATR
jgi:hypothetical protein